MPHIKLKFSHSTVKDCVSGVDFSQQKRRKKTTDECDYSFALSQTHIHTHKMSKRSDKEMYAKTIQKHYSENENEN